MQKINKKCENPKKRITIRLTTTNEKFQSKENFFFLVYNQGYRRGIR